MVDLIKWSAAAWHCVNKIVEIFVSGCASDERSEAFELWCPQQSSGSTSELRDRSTLRSPLQTVTIPTGTIISQLCQ